MSKVWVFNEEQLAAVLDAYQVGAPEEQRAGTRKALLEFLHSDLASALGIVMECKPRLPSEIRRARDAA
jgi:hypothetical protein